MLDGLPMAEHRPEETSVGTTDDKAVMTSPVTDVREAPLGKLSAPGLLDRLRPEDRRKVAVAAFNASL